MTNPYVLGGYLAVAAILGLYALHVRHRARALGRVLGVGNRTRGGKDEA